MTLTIWRINGKKNKAQPEPERHEPKKEQALKPGIKEFWEKLMG